MRSTKEAFSEQGDQDLNFRNKRLMNLFKQVVSTDSKSSFTLEDSQLKKNSNF